MTTTADRVVAKRGDLVVIAEMHATYHQTTGRTTMSRVRMGRVTSVTRDGIVKRAELADGDLWTRERDYRSSTTVLVASPAEVDVDATLTAYGARRYPTAPHSQMVPPCDSMAEARSLIVRR